MTADEPRLMSEDDIAWLTYLCRKRYSHEFDRDSTIAWFRNVVLKSPLMFYAVRSDEAFCITMLSVVPWVPGSVEANVVFICADEGAMWQAMRLLRCSIAWSRRRKCSVWRLSSDSEYDFAPLAKRLGATELSPRYVLQLGDR